MLLLTGTTIREVPGTLRSLFGTRMFGYDDEEAFDDPAVESDVAEDFSDGYYDDSSSHGDDEAQAWPASSSIVSPDDTPTVPEPAVSGVRRRSAKPSGKQDTRCWTESSKGPIRCRR